MLSIAWLSPPPPPPPPFVVGSPLGAGAGAPAVALPPPAPPLAGSSCPACSPVWHCTSMLFGAIKSATRLPLASSQL
jgi:hypothetical protein